MNPSTININGIDNKPPDYPSSASLLRSLSPPKKQKKIPVLFATVLAHEVRNPLTNINLSIEMLESAIKDNELKLFLEIIKRSSIRINDLISELLKCQEPVKVQTKKYSIHQLLDEVIEMAKDRIKLKNIVVTKEYAIKDYKIIFNRTRMKFALTNIIINAIDAMTAENRELKLVTKSVDGRYVILIEDNGCGISEGNMQYIFNPYFTNKPGGMGIGLSSTYDILKANNVGVNVESGEGAGTRFILLFEKNNQHNTLAMGKKSLLANSR